MLGEEWRSSSWESGEVRRSWWMFEYEVSSSRGSNASLVTTANNTVLYILNVLREWVSSVLPTPKNGNWRGNKRELASCGNHFTMRSVLHQHTVLLRCMFVWFFFFGQYLKEADKDLFEKVLSLTELETTHLCHQR